MPILLTEKATVNGFSTDYTPSPQMLKRLDGLNKNKSLHWELNDAELFYIQTHYPTYKLTPLVYIIKTEVNIEKPSNTPGIIKKLNKGAQKGKRFIRTSLKKSEVDILKKFNVFYKPVKFLITSL